MTPEEKAARDRRRAENSAALDALARSQSGAVSRAQLRSLGVHREEVRRRVAARQWTLRSANVVGTATGPPTAAESQWIAVLHAARPVALSGRTALQLHGLRGWEGQEVEAIVRSGEHHPAPGVRYHRTRRPFEAWVEHRGRLPLLHVDAAALLLASRLAHPRSAAGVLAACVQQRLTTPAALAAMLEELPALRGRSRLGTTISDLSGGAQSVAEIDLGLVCRDAGLAPPNRQVRRRDSAGQPRWTDAEWDLPSGDVVVLEVDGSFHRDVESWIADKRRQRRLSAPGRMVVGCTAIELRTRPEDVVADLVALGVPCRRTAA